MIPLTGKTRYKFLYLIIHKDKRYKLFKKSEELGKDIFLLDQKMFALTTLKIFQVMSLRKSSRHSLIKITFPRCRSNAIREALI